MAAKFDWKGYFEPTPRLFRKIGDGILGIGSSISATTLIVGLNVESEKTQHLLMTITIITIALTTIGKFLSNFFKEDDDVQQ